MTDFLIFFLFFYAILITFAVWRLLVGKMTWERLCGNLRATLGESQNLIEKLDAENSRLKRTSGFKHHYSEVLDDAILEAEVIE